MGSIPIGSFMQLVKVNRYEDLHIKECAVSMSSVYTPFVPDIRDIASGLMPTILDAPGLTVAYLMRIRDREDRGPIRMPFKLKLVLDDFWADVGGSMVGTFYRIPPSELESINKAINKFVTEQIES